MFCMWCVNIYLGGRAHGGKREDEGEEEDEGA
jgi:hypothetical protein